MKMNSPTQRSGWKITALPRTFALCLLGTLLAGCPASKPSDDAASAPAAGSAGKTKVIVRGSNTIGEELAPKLITEFKKDHADVDFDTEFKGTGYGLGALSSDSQQHRRRLPRRVHQ